MLPLRAGSAAAITLVLLTGCFAGHGTPTPTETIDYDVAPRWDATEDVGETRVSFDRGVELMPGSRVDFRSRLGEIYDWETVGTPTEDLAELVNANAGCRVRDETSAYLGSADDETASRDLIRALLAEYETLGGPQRGVAGIGEGLGEGAPMYDVMHALAGDPAGGYVYVTGRVFAALGVQHAITVRCELGGYLDRTRAQIAGATWVDLELPEDIPPPVVVAEACTRDDLTIRYVPFEPGVNELTGILEFRNDSGATCSVEGHPVVYFSVAGATETWGPPAARGTTWAAVPVDLEPGVTATAALTIRRASTMCAEPIPIDGLEVAVPVEPFDAGAALRQVAADGIEACPDPAVQLLSVEGIAR